MSYQGLAHNKKKAGVAVGFRLAGGATELTNDQLKDALLHRMECKVCPFDKLKTGKHHHMAPTGTAKPLIYILGEAPGKDEAEEGEQFVGESGQLLRPQIPRAFKPRIRWNNTIRCRPPKNRTPERTEVECCRPSVARDIASSRPKAIFGFGNVPLHWISGMSGITGWRGRRFPVNVEGYACWYYPMFHPAFLVRKGRGKNTSEDERTFRMDLKRAFAEIEDLDPAPWPHTPQRAREGVKLLKTVKGIEQALAWAIEQPLIGFDYETDRLRPYSKEARILTVAFSDGVKSYTFGLDHPGVSWSEQDKARIRAVWVNFIRKAKGIKVAHSLTFEMEWTCVYFKDRTLARAGKWGDTATQAAIIDERTGKQRPGCFALGFLTMLYFGFNVKKISLIDTRKLANQPLDRVLDYNALDAKYCALIWVEQAERITADKLTAPHKLAQRRVPTAVLSQIKGVPVNQDEARRLQKKYANRIATATEKIAELKATAKFKRTTGRDFNPNSAPDVIQIFHEVLGRGECEVTDKYGNEKLSADADVLEKIDHPLARHVLTLRTASKRKATFIDPLLPGNPLSTLHEDGQVHTSYNTYTVETGRLSSDSPNLQQWPHRDEEGVETRRPIQAPPGCKVVAMDYGQIEARVLAMFTHDKRFCKALWERYDVHGEWAERIARAYPSRIGGRKNLTDKAVMKKFRTDVKNQWSFPLFYGCSVQSASNYLNIPIEVVEPLFDEFWEQFSGIRDWQEDLIEFYQQHGYVECLTGRRRRAPLSMNMVLNSPVQGTAAEIVMDAMCRLSETGDWELQPEINVHDDLTWLRVPEKGWEDHCSRVLDILLDVPFDWVNVPITVEIAEGPNWEQLRPVEGDFSTDLWFK
jgi:uracil-DNA glycosylase family 4